ncbi:glycosyltransferase family 4 protein [Leptospira ilyithenensis]|uniref:Glycosyltransferase family 1 protein n=1 Tax=Leptospira ilyithenensis TaxID=2484901 RepID=A0A4R9LND9_9LEPT|nr:glycosyltransferase family 1 protein [Leptospira ilyithenensis]TGN08237.1 glycosyltransferase family 1 protein [Leptospira ilyithenensis]
MVEVIRIGMDARPLSTRISGVGRLIAETIKAFPNPEKYHFYLFSHLPIHKDHNGILSLSNITFVSRGGAFKWKGGIYYNLFLPILFRFFKLDLFWGSQQILPPFLPRKLKAVLTYCDLVLYLYPKTMRPLARIQQRMFQRYSVKRASHILSISKQTSEDMCSFFGYDPEKTGVSYPGVNQKEIDEALLDTPSRRITDLGENYILSVSTIEPRKNYPFLLKVFREYRRLNPKEHQNWVIVGKIGWESQEFIEELRQEQSLFGDLHILDSIADIDLQHIYKNAGLFVFASHYEGFGIPMLEAIYQKKYCMVSDIPTFREIGGTGVTYLPYRTDADAKEWANEILKFYKNPILPTSDISSFTWENAASITEKAFQKTLSAR